MWTIYYCRHRCASSLIQLSRRRGVTQREKRAVAGEISRVLVVFATCRTSGVSPSGVMNALVPSSRMRARLTVLGDDSAVFASVNSSEGKSMSDAWGRICFRPVNDLRSSWL